MSARQSGHFIVLEGIDGSGKGTQLALLQEHLEREGHTVYVTREPSVGEIGQLARRGLGDSTHFDEATMALLFAADRLDHLHTIQSKLNEGAIVLCDRYVLSSLAYNSQSLTLDWILSLNSVADQRLHPDLTLLFTLDVQTAMRRIGTRGNERERYETQHQLYQVQEMYRMLADVRRDDNVTTIDATASPDAIHESVWQAVVAIL